MKRGLFVTFEGIEGCGKSTQVKLAADALKAAGGRCFCTREPGGTDIGAQIRKIVLSESNFDLLSYSECLLYLADRFQHICDVVEPHLKQGDVVLCDRYHDSTVAYQGYARGVPLDWLEATWQGSGLALKPDLTLLLDIDPELGLRRSFQKLQKEKLDEARFEKEEITFHKKVREGFISLSILEPQRIKVIDASGPIEEVHSKVMQILVDRVKLERTREIF